MPRTDRDIATARQVLAPHFATDGEDDQAEIVEALLGSIATAIAAERERIVEMLRDGLTSYIAMSGDEYTAGDHAGRQALMWAIRAAQSEGQSNGG